jgi:hypothetical protein
MKKFDSGFSTRDNEGLQERVQNLCRSMQRCHQPSNIAAGVAWHAIISNMAFVSAPPARHPDKTSLGRTDRGFDFLGYRFEAAGLGLAARTKQQFVERVTRLYEQGATTTTTGTTFDDGWHG